MLRFATCDLDNDDVVAVLHRDGDKLLVVLNAAITDSRARCEAVNRLLTPLQAA